MLARVKAGRITSRNCFKADRASENLFLLIELFHHFFIAMYGPTQTDCFLLLISFLHWDCLWRIRYSFSRLKERGRLFFFAAQGFWQFCTRIGLIFILFHAQLFLFFFCGILLISDCSTCFLRRESPSSSHPSTVHHWWNRLWLGCLRCILHHLRTAPFYSWLACLAIFSWWTTGPFFVLGGLSWCCLRTKLHLIVN